MTETAVVQPGDTYARLHQQITERGPWMQTYSGRAFFLADPKASEVFIEDIAHALSNLARYNGHTQRFYSVAQHAWLVSHWMEEDGCTVEECYAGLHHDSAEAYTGDIPSYLKYIVPEFKWVEFQVELAVEDAFELSVPENITRLVKEYDLIALATEKRDVLGPNLSPFTWGDMPEPRSHIRIVPWEPPLARAYFLERHEELKRRRG